MNAPIHNGAFQPAPKKRVAVIGSGISGASAAWFLRNTHDVTLYESEARAGGHTCTVDIDYDGRPVSVDVGFIVYNERNYPNLCALFDALGVKTEQSNMSFSMSLDGGKREWSGESVNAIFARRRNMVSPRFYGMLLEVLRFNRNAIADRNSGYMRHMTIGEYLKSCRFSSRFRDDYLIPMAAAIWSTPEVKMMDFPARAFVNFFENHRLLEISPPLWRTVSGGSRHYHEKLMADLGDRVRLATPVQAISRSEGVVAVRDHKGNIDHFDDVIIATHSDQALAMLSDANDAERAILSQVGYKPNRVVLHRDARFMPRRRAAWAAWNSMRTSRAGPDSEISLTYWMNRLQNIDQTMPIFVTLNPAFEPDPSQVFGEWQFDHPQYDAAAFDAQARLHTIQGKNQIQFAGAWTGYGFHEDGLKSGIAAARALGGIVPWMDGVAANDQETLPILEAAQ